MPLTVQVRRMPGKNIADDHFTASTGGSGHGGEKKREKSFHAILILNPTKLTNPQIRITGRLILILPDRPQEAYRQFCRLSILFQFRFHSANLKTIHLLLAQIICSLMFVGIASEQAAIPPI
ncbi:MAG TPA: hypothetical protein VNN22_14615 [Verrucomicrobiae bacterium]|nr:hypothetical protein [Verrucomicrobiae bacterium]